jgi:hypothetical protein
VSGLVTDSHCRPAPVLTEQPSATFYAAGEVPRDRDLLAHLAIGQATNYGIRQM